MVRRPTLRAPLCHPNTSAAVAVWVNSMQRVWEGTLRFKPWSEHAGTFHSSKKIKHQKVFVFAHCFPSFLIHYINFSVCACWLFSGTVLLQWGGSRRPAKGSGTLPVHHRLTAHRILTSVCLHVSVHFQYITLSKHRGVEITAFSSRSFLVRGETKAALSTAGSSADFYPGCPSWHNLGGIWVSSRDQSQDLLLVRWTCKPLH